MPSPAISDYIAARLLGAAQGAVRPAEFLPDTDIASLPPASPGRCLLLVRYQDDHTDRITLGAPCLWRETATVLFHIMIESRSLPDRLPPLCGALDRLWRDHAALILGQPPPSLAPDFDFIITSLSAPMRIGDGINGPWAETQIRATYRADYYR